MERAPAEDLLAHGDTEHRQAAPAPRSLAVFFADGTPAQGATLTWTPVAPILLESAWDWDEIDLAWWREASTRTTADERGSAELDTPESEDDLGSVLWIDLPGREPLVDVLAPETSSLAGRRYELAEADAVEVRVLNASGTPVGDAVVEQHGFKLRPDIEAPAHAPLLFHRSRTTDADGICEVSRFPGRQALVARGEGLVSRPILIGESRDEVVLRLHEPFTASGTVTRPTSDQIQGEVVPRITIGARQGTVWRELATAVSRRDGSWGPLTVPLVEADVYRAEVLGVGVIPSSTTFPKPEPGEHVTLHLEAEIGLVQWLIGYDGEEGVPLPGTTANISWEEGGELKSVSAQARPDGYACVLGIRPGPIRASITKPGYVGMVFPGYELPLAEPRTFSGILVPAAPVSGRVVYPDGRPATDFDLVWWPGPDTALRSSKSYRDRPDGTFVIDAEPGVPIGIAAGAPGAPGSEPQQVEVPEEGPRDLVIELAPAIRGSGQVVSIDGEPLADAEVQPYVLGNDAAVHPWGPPIPVDVRGAFRMEACRDGKNVLIVRAPDHSPQEVFAESEGGHVDFGVIEMRRAVGLRVVIENPMEGLHRVRSRGSPSRATTEFERREDGALVGELADMPMGEQLLELTFPDVSTAFIQVVVDEQGGVARFRGGTGRLTAFLDAQSAPSGPLELGVEMLDGAGYDYRIVDFDPEGKASIGRLPAGKARVYLRQVDKVLTSTTTTIVPGQTSSVELRVGETDLLVQVVDAEDEPVAGANARLVGTDESASNVAGTTNENGEFRFRSLEPGAYALYVIHPTLGVMPEVSVAFGGEDQELELVLDASASLELLVVDDDDVLSGITCRLLGQHGKYLSSPVLTNGEGLASIPRLTPGSYVLHVSSSSIWDLESEIEVRDGMGLRSVEVRRLGDLVVRVVNEDGVPVSEADVDLTDGKTGTPVQEWVAAGLVEGPPGLTSDQHGEIALVGLPHGTYAWSTGSGEGTIVVEPAEETEALVSGP